MRRCTEPYILRELANRSGLNRAHHIRKDAAMAVQNKGLGELPHQEAGMGAGVRRSFFGTALSILGIAVALVGPFLVYGISIELTGIILGALGYSFGLQREDRLGQALGATAVILCVISIGVSGLTGPPQ
jgi:hypothetical protein